MKKAEKNIFKLNFYTLSTYKNTPYLGSSLYVDFKNGITIELSCKKIMS